MPVHCGNFEESGIDISDDLTYQFALAGCIPPLEDHHDGQFCFGQFHLGCTEVLPFFPDTGSEFFFIDRSETFKILQHGNSSFRAPAGTVYDHILTHEMEKKAEI